MRVASEVELSSTIVVVVVAFVVYANTDDDGAKVVPMIASAAITRLTIARTATNIIIIIIGQFIEQRKRTKNLYGFRRMTCGRDSAILL
jgi:predicted DNA-binding ribbon-helix-helix protein